MIFLWFVWHQVFAAILSYPVVIAGLSSLCIEVRNLSLNRAHVVHERFIDCWPLPHVTGSPDLRVLSANLTAIRPSDHSHLVSSFDPTSSA